MLCRPSLVASVFNMASKSILSGVETVQNTQQLAQPVIARLRGVSSRSWTRTVCLQSFSHVFFLEKNEYLYTSVAYGRPVWYRKDQDQNDKSASKFGPNHQCTATHPAVAFPVILTRLST